MRKNLNSFVWLFTVLLLTIFISSCEKNADNVDAPIGEVSIAINDMVLNGDGLKSGNDDDMPLCSDEAPSYVEITLSPGVDGQTVFSVDVLENLDLGYSTEVLKFPVGTQTITDFKVFDADDNLIFLSPKGGSFDQFLTNAVGNGVEIEVVAFEKKKVIVDVLCFEEKYTLEFGYWWGELNPFAKKEVCFYGNICTKFWKEFHDANLFPNGPYIGQTGNEGYDFNAIYKVKVTNVTTGEVMAEGDTKATFGGKLCLEYVDEYAVEEDYIAEIWLVEPNGNELLVHTEAFTDQNWSNVDPQDPLAPEVPFGGADGIFDFVVGNCVSEDSPYAPDVILDAYLPLPSAVEFKLRQNGSTYVTAELRAVVGANALGQMADGKVLDGWCGDKEPNINTGRWYPANVWTSADVNNMPAHYAAYGQEAWNKVNWLINQDLSGQPKNKIQNAIWNILNDKNLSDNGLAATAATHNDYKVRPGDFLLVLLDPTADDDQEKIGLQLIVIQVDP